MTSSSSLLARVPERILLSLSGGAAGLVSFGGSLRRHFATQRVIAEHHDTRVFCLVSLVLWAGLCGQCCWIGTKRALNTPSLGQRTSARSSPMLLARLDPRSSSPLRPYPARDILRGELVYVLEKLLAFPQNFYEPLLGPPLVLLGQLI